MKKKCETGDGSFRFLNKVMLIMKLITFFILIFTFNVTGSVYSQNTRLTLNMSGNSIKEVLREIELKSEFRFIYECERIDVNKKIDLQIKDETIENILKKLFDQQGIRYEITESNLILINPKLKTVVKGVSNTKIGEQKKSIISGRVTDIKGVPIPGVSIVVKGTIVGVSTDVDGNYSLDVPANAKVLQFSFVGMKMQEVVLKGQSTIDVKMTEDAIGLQEVVAIGYGVQKKVNLTGSVASVSAEKLENRSSATVSSVLQGQMPGVTITQRSGQPGADGGTIRIRGIGTLGGNSEPLILVDGIATTSMDNVNPNDIASVSVLKDAASAAIYGSRAANGVMLITTKRGGENKVGISINSYVGWQTPTRLPKYLGAVDYMILHNEAATNVGQPVHFTQQDIDNWKQHGGSDAYPDTDWLDEAFTGNGLTQSHHLGLNGGNDKTRYMFSFGYLNQGGLIKNTGFERYNFRLNIDSKLFEKLNVAINLSGTSSDKEEPGVGLGGMFANAKRIPPIYAARFSDGRYGQWNGDNPIAMVEAGGIANDKIYRSQGNFKATLELVKGLSIEGSVGYNLFVGNYTRQRKAVQLYQYDKATSSIIPSVIAGTPNNLDERNSVSLNVTSNALVKYEKKINDHSINAIVGFSAETFRSDWFNAFRENFPNDDLTELNAGSPADQQNGGSASEWSLLSMFSRVNYNYKEKYLLEGNLRYDGSSRFTKGNRFGVFPSVSAGWRVSEESFLEDAEFLDNLKIRASWGELGNQNALSLYPFAETISFTESYSFGGAIKAGGAQLALANRNLTWETTKVTNIGFDTDLWNGLLRVSADYFSKKTVDILLNFPVPNLSGYLPFTSGAWSSIGQAKLPQNAGSIKNTGFEFAVGHKNKIGDLSYQISANLGILENKVTDLKGQGPIIENGTIIDENLPIRAFYGYETDGLFQSDKEVQSHAFQHSSTGAGDIKYVDQNKDGKINGDDRVVIGNPNPNYTFGFTCEADYKGFDFSLFLQGVGKASGYLSSHAIQAFSNGGKVREKHLDRWTPDNTDASYPRFTLDRYHNFSSSDYWVQDASYVRLKNIQLGYTLNRSLLGDSGIDQVRIYFSGENLLTLSGFDKEYDPETPAGGANNYPQVQLFTVGLNVKF